MNIEDLIGVDFFCGSGGMTAGMRKAGIDVRFGLDIDKNCKETYEQNNKIPFICGDISRVTGNKIRKAIGKRNRRPLFFAGCAPCQPFSKVRKSGVKRHPDRNLISYFMKMILEFKPNLILCENVPQIVNPGCGEKLINDFISTLQSLGYSAVMGIVNAKDYDVPQNRLRHVIIASKSIKNMKIPVGPTKNSPPTVRSAIYDLPKLEAGEKCNTVPNHWTANLSPKNIDRIRAVPHNGGDLRVVDPLLWPKSRVNSKKYGKGGFFDVYGRMKWDAPAPTLTTRCISYSNGRYGHPEQNRAISIREAARLQSFDDDYIFFTSNLGNAAKMVGNAVPVNLAYNLIKGIFSEKLVN